MRRKVGSLVHKLHEKAESTGYLEQQNSGWIVVRNLDLIPL